MTPAATEDRAESLLTRASELLQRWASKVVPDPFVIALALTGLVIAGGAWRLQLAGETGIGWRILDGWFSGFSGEGGLAFALQMCLVLITGHAIALSPPVQRGIARIAVLPRDTPSAALLVGSVGCAASVIHWGLGAITGALLAREVARHALANGVRLHYPILGGAAYAGFAVWHGGLSGSAPLKVAEAGNFLEAKLGLVPLSETLLSPLNLAITGSLVVLIPAAFWAIAPRGDHSITPPDPALLAPLPKRERAKGGGWIAALQESPWVGGILGATGLALTLLMVFAGRRSVDLNTVNLLFLAAGLLLQGSLSRYVEAVADGARGAGGIILQFPFYFGIVGVMKATGLIEWASNLFLSIASADTFPVFAFLSAGLVNFFVPSGGGQWAVQGDILASASQALGVRPGSMVMAFSYGDAWTNLIQPFWALPLLGIMGLKARDIIGYGALICVLMGAVVIAGLAVLG